MCKDGSANVSRDDHACDYLFLDLSAVKDTDLQAMARMDDTARAEAIKRIAKSADKVSVEECTQVTPMSAAAEVSAAATFLFGVPGFGIVFPVTLLALAILYGLKAAFLAAAVTAPLAFLPYKFRDENLSSWLAFACMRYFSFKAVYPKDHAPFQKGKPYILVAPPHGVFPYGNIATMIIYPSIAGFNLRGLASSAVFSCPVIRHFLGWVGCIDASRPSATRALEAGHTIGISTGGVAEIFETNSKTGDEVIVLQNRKGLCKLALWTGAPLVPCYLFGNNAALSLKYDPWGYLKWLSRRLGFALIIFWGRWGLPVPWRVPIVGALGKPIEVGPPVSEPEDADVEALHAKLVVAMIELFDAHKARYGWAHKRLIVR